MKGSLRITLAALLILQVIPTGSGQESRTARVGVLFWHHSPNDEEAWLGVGEGFRLAGIRATFDRRDVKGDREAAHEALRHWESEGYDLVYAMGTNAALRAGEATTSIPVVFTAVTNPVGANVIESWEGSGTNLCGNSNWIGAGDVLKVFRAAIPSLARLGVVYTVENPVPAEEIRDAKKHFQREPSQEVKLIEEWIEDADSLDGGDFRALEEAVTKVLDRGAQALWVPIDHHIYRHLDRIAKITMPRGVPIVSSQASTVKTHAVVAVAVNYRALGRNSVVLADRVLRGVARPGDLPVGRMRAFRVLVNLSAARRTGFEVPLTLLATADRILDREESR